MLSEAHSTSVGLATLGPRLYFIFHILIRSHWNHNWTYNISFFSKMTGIYGFMITYNIIVRWELENARFWNGPRYLPSSQIRKRDPPLQGSHTGSYWEVHKREIWGPKQDYSPPAAEYWGQPASTTNDSLQLTWLYVVQRLTGCAREMSRMAHSPCVWYFRVNIIFGYY